MIASREHEGSALAFLTLPAEHQALLLGFDSSVTFTTQTWWTKQGGVVRETATGVKVAPPKQDAAVQARLAPGPDASASERMAWVMGGG